MSKRRRWHPQAVLEARAAIRWYKEQDAPEVAETFRAALRRAVDEITEAPRRWPRLIWTLRKRPLRGFPYRVVYDVPGSGDHVLIVAIMHEHQRPGYWRERT